MTLPINKWLVVAGVAGSAMLAVNATAAEVDSPNASMRYAAISTLHDSDHNRQTTATVSLTFGDHGWAHVGGGKARVQQANATVNPTLGNIGVGFAGQQWTATLEARRRKDGDRYDQRDWNGSLEWRNEVLGIGIDGLHRNTDIEAVVPVTGAQGTTNVPVAESLRGNGIGLHAYFNLTQRLNVFFGGMSYDYDATTRQNGTVTTTSGSGGVIGIVNNALNNRPLLAQQVLLQTTGATREAAILQRSYNAGVRYRFDSVTLTAQYFNDQALDSNDSTNTAELSAAVFLSEQWTIAPAIGRSSNDQFGSVTFGSMTVRYGW